jgi:hypothetical protein
MLKFLDGIFGASMKKNKYSLAIITTSILIIIFAFNKPEDKLPETAYWLWAGITANDAPPHSNLYVYQGQITEKTYERLGLYPYPIDHKNLYLVFRLEGNLPEATRVVEIFMNNEAMWEKHSVKLTGIQLDFDSPTAKLLIYSDFLHEIRKQLPKQYKLSITGLGDWAIHGAKETMHLIANNTDEIVFQLYQGRTQLTSIASYISGLKKYPYPFKIGLLHNNKSVVEISELNSNANFKGIIYFIQR